MNGTRTCPRCGTMIQSDWKQPLCPGCLLKAGEQTQPGGAEATLTLADTLPLAGGAAAGELAAAQALFPDLEVLEVIGRGGMGVVYRARQPKLDRLVALKLLPAALAARPGFADRFAREARALARLNHPNIVTVYDYGNQAGHFFLLMEYVDGGNLRQMIAAKQITPEAALSIVPKVCEALQYAHDEGVLHRDIKPENILIDHKGRVKIADFGLAKLVDDQTTDHSLTGTHQVMGTPRYMAPEQFENTKSVDHRADIYSLGVVFYEMLTGEIPMGRFAPPSQKVQVDVRIDEVVLRSLEREPAQRYQHVSEIKTDVDHITLAGSGGILPPQKEREMPARDGGKMSPFPNASTEDNRSFLRRLADEPVIGKAAVVIAIAALFAHKLQWHSLIVPGNQVLSPPNSAVGSVKASVMMLVLSIATAVFAAVPGLGVSPRRIVRSIAGGFVLVALWFQASFYSTLGLGEPGQTGIKLRMTQSYPEAGLYATIALTALALVFFIIRCFEDKHAMGLKEGGGGPKAPTVGHSGGAHFQSLEDNGSGAVPPPVESRASGGGTTPLQKAPNRFPGLPLWGWFVATALLALAAVVLPKPGDLPMPKEADSIFRPVMLIAPEGDAYRFVSLQESKSLPRVYAVNFRITAQQEGVRTLGYSRQDGLGLGFFLRKGSWKFDLTATRFSDWKGPVDGPTEIPAADAAKLKPRIVEELNKRDLRGGRLLEDVLQNGRRVETIVCWQNAVVLAAWLCAALLAFALAKALFTTRARRVSLVVLAVAAGLALVLFGSSPRSSPAPEAVVTGSSYRVALGPGELILLLVLIIGAGFALRARRRAQVPTAAVSGVGNVPSPGKPLDHRVSEVVTKGIPGWFNARAKWVQSLVQAVLIVVVWAGLIAFIGFNFRASAGPGHAAKRLTLGIPSPWLEIVDETNRWAWLIHPTSSSALLATLGVLAAILFERIRRSRPGFDAEKDRRAMRKWWIAAGVVAVLFIAALAVLLNVR